MLRCLGLLAMIGWLCSAVPAWAERLPVTRKGANEAQAEDIARLIEDLDQSEFADRQEASRKLRDLGQEAMAELERAVIRGNREVSARALGILKQHFEGQDGDVKQAAKESLERLANSSNAAIAQRARNVLFPSKEAASRVAGGVMPGGFPGMPGGGIFGGGRGFGGGVVIRQVSMRTDANGTRRIDIQDNGRTTTIETKANGRISMTLPETKNGRETTRTVEANDLDDLKKKDPQAAQIYEQNERQPAIRLGALPNLRVAPGTRGVPIPVVPTPPPPSASLKRTLDSIDASIERFKTRLPDDPSAQQTIDALERTKQHFKDLLPQDAAANGK